MPPGTTLAISPSILAVANAGRPAQPPHSSSSHSSSLKKRKQPGDPVHFSPSLASYTTHLFHARRPPPATASGLAPEPSSSPSSLTSMPRPMPPPTPGSSSDIRGKDAAQNAALASFNLPPTAYPDDRDRNSSTPSNNGSDSSYRPVSPGIPSKRPAGAVIGKEDFELPPPPTRSRKIIQMKPQSELPIEAETTVVGAQQQPSKPQAGKRKQTAGTTAAGRKIARKTAHSLIERRRRSKMNEEFGVLKDMIPACKGQEMHKLAILQASIDYLRYLEKCVADLRQNSQGTPSQRQAFHEPTRPTQTTPLDVDDDEEEDEEEEDGEDQEMEDDPPAPPSTSSAISTPGFRPQPDKRDSQISLPSLSTITTTSPSIFSHTAGRHYSISSASQASYSPYFHSTHTSPAFGPQLSHISSSSAASASGGLHAFGIGSPALKPLDHQQQQQQQQAASSSSSSFRPSSATEAASEMSLARPANGSRSGNGHLRGRSEQDMDQEAAGGLLMLNSDRRSWQQKERERAAGAGGGTNGNGGGASGPPSGRLTGLGGMSVKDLLTG